VAPSFLFPPRSARDLASRRTMLLLCNTRYGGRMVSLEPSSQGRMCAWIPRARTTGHQVDQARAERRICIPKPGRASLLSSPPLLCSRWPGWIPKPSRPAATHKGSQARHPPAPTPFTPTQPPRAEPSLHLGQHCEEQQGSHSLRGASGASLCRAWVQHKEAPTPLSVTLGL